MGLTRRAVFCVSGSAGGHGYHTVHGRFINQFDTENRGQAQRPAHTGMFSWPSDAGWIVERVSLKAYPNEPTATDGKSSAGIGTHAEQPPRKRENRVFKGT